MESVIAKIRKWRSDHYWNALPSAFVAAFDAKASKCTGLLKFYLAGGNRMINCQRQVNQNRLNWNIWQKPWCSFFTRVTSVFSYLCWKTNKHTAPIYYV